MCVHEQSAGKYVVQASYNGLTLGTRSNVYIHFSQYNVNFTYCKVDNYAFNYQIVILKLAEKPFYGVG